MPCIIFQAKDFAVPRLHYWSKSRQRAFADLRDALVARVAADLAKGIQLPESMIERLTEPTDHMRYPFRSERTWMMAALITTGRRRTYITVVYFGFDNDRRFENGGLIDILHGENLCRTAYNTYVQNGTLVIEVLPTPAGEPVDVACENIGNPNSADGAKSLGAKARTRLFWQFGSSKTSSRSSSLHVGKYNSELFRWRRNRWARIVLLGKMSSFKKVDMARMQVMRKYFILSSAIGQSTMLPRLDKIAVGLLVVQSGVDITRRSPMDVSFSPIGKTIKKSALLCLSRIRKVGASPIQSDGNIMF